MNFNTITELMDSLKAVISTEVCAANDRADAAESAFRVMRESLLSALEATEPTRVESRSGPEVGVEAKNADTLSENEAVPGNSESLLQRRRKLTDEELMRFLTEDWQTAKIVRAAVLATGWPVAEGTIYNRLRRLASQYPHRLLSTTKPERWRLKSSKMSHVRNADGSEVKKPSRQSRGSSEARATSTLSAAPNDNDAERFKPTLHYGNCLEVMKSIPDGSIDLILADLPYGTTGLAIDEQLPLDRVWEQYRRIIRKPSGNIVLFGSQPFTTDLINGARDLFKYQVVWEKNTSTGFPHSADRPLKTHEDILVFSYGVNISAKRARRRATFNPQGVIPVQRKGRGRTCLGYLNNAVRGHTEGHEYTGLTNCPKDVLRFPKDRLHSDEAHPFGKPVALLEYLIRSYSNAGETVLDNTMGSGSTCVAAVNTSRRSIGIEKERRWFELGEKRVAEALASEFPQFQDKFVRIELDVGYVDASAEVQGVRWPQAA